MKNTQEKEYEKAWATEMKHRYLALFSFLTVCGCIVYNVIWEISLFSLENYNFIFIALTTLCLFFIKETKRNSIIFKRILIISLLITGVLSLFLQVFGLVIYVVCYTAYVNNCKGFEEDFYKLFMCGTMGNSCELRDIDKD